MSIQSAGNAGLIIANKQITKSDTDYLAVVKFLTVPKDRQSAPAFKGSDVAAIKALEDNGLRQIADGMMAAKTPYTFAAIATAQAEFRFRRVAVDTMTKMNTGAFDADYFDPINNVPPRAGSTYLDPSQQDPHWNIGESWAPIGNPTTGPSLRNPKTWQAAFIARDDVSSAIPIMGRELPFRGECAGALQITVNLAAREVLGEAGYSAANPSSTIKLGEWDSSSSVNYMDKVSVDEPPVYGDYMYFRNDPRYPKLAPNGFWQGLNALYVGKDALGVERYSGLGVSWQSAPEIRALMKNAFLGDAGVKADPSEIKFTLRASLVLHKPGLGDGEPQLGASNVPRAGKGGLTPAILEAAGFRHEGDNVFSRSDVSIGELGKALDFRPHMLGQTISAPFENPAYRVDVDGTPVIVEYNHANASRQSASTIVSAYARA